MRKILYIYVRLDKVVENLKPGRNARVFFYVKAFIMQSATSFAENLSDSFSLT